MGVRKVTEEFNSVMNGKVEYRKKNCSWGSVLLMKARELSHHLVGKNIILVTHDLDDIIPEISRVVLLRDGKVFLDGSKDYILTAENLSGLFDMDVEVTCEKGYYRTWIDPLSI